MAEDYIKPQEYQIIDLKLQMLRLAMQFPWKTPDQIWVAYKQIKEETGIK